MNFFQKINQPSINWSFAQMVFYCIYYTAAGTTFLVGYFRYIGFNEMQIAGLGSVSGIASFVSVFGTWYAQKRGNYRNIVIVLYIASVLFCMGGILLGAFGGSNKIIPILVLALMALFLLCTYIAIPIVLAWLHGNVGNKKWHTFFSTRLSIGDAAVLGTVLLAGYYLGEAPGLNKFLAVFSVACATCLLGIITIRKMPDPVVIEKLPDSAESVNIILGAFMKKDVRKLFIIVFLRSFAYSFIMPFQPLFLLEVIKFDYARISYLICLGTVFSIFFYRIWAVFQKRAGDYNSLKLNLALSCIEPFLWMFVTQNNSFLIYIAFAVFGFYGAQGMVNAGFWPSYMGLILSLSNEQQKPVYTALYYFVLGPATLIAPLIAGFVLLYYNKTPLLFSIGGLAAVDGYRIIFAIAGFVLIFTTIYAMFGRGIQSPDAEKQYEEKERSK